MQMIRYHPLIDGDTDGLEKVPMFFINRQGNSTAEQ